MLTHASTSSRASRDTFVLFLLLRKKTVKSARKPQNCRKKPRKILIN